MTKVSPTLLKIDSYDNRSRFCYFVQLLIRGVLNLRRREWPVKATAVILEVVVQL